MPTMGALAGVRVLDLTDESGRLAGKVLAQLGADVVRLRRGAAGAALRSGAGGVLEWWFDGGSRIAELDLDEAAGRDAFLGLVRGADVLLETTAPGWLAARGLDVEDLRALQPALVHVSLTPFGRSGPRAHWRASDLVVAALGGLLSVSGTPEKPLNAWGRQWFNVGGLYAAFAALVGLRAAAAGKAGMHFDLSLQHCATTCSEQLLMYWLHLNSVPRRQAALHWTGVYDVFSCRDGHVMMTPAPSAENLMDWLIADGMAGSLGESPARTPIEWAGRAAEAMGVLRAWAMTKESEPVFHEGQRKNLSFGLVRSVAQCAACPQHAARDYFRPHAGGAVRSPGLPFRLSATPSPEMPPPRAARLEDVAAAWTPRPAQPRGDGAGIAPLAGIRVLDFTWVLAGPMATRMLADLGADVIKLQTEERSQGANHNEFPFFLMWNRNKRSAGLNMKQPGAIEVFRKLLQEADVVVDNFAPGVLERWGIGHERMRAWNPRIIHVAMSGCGVDGPWRDFVTFAPTIQALCGLTYLTNPTDRRDVGIGVSLNDHVSGMFGAVAILAALETRRRTGEGQFVDLSQLEVGTYLAGPALLDFLDSGRAAEPRGNEDAFEPLVPNEVYACADGEWLALTAHDDGEWQRLCGAIGAGDLATDADLARAEGRVRRRAEIDARIAAWAAGRNADAAMRLLQDAGVAAGMAQNARHLTDDDEQLRAREWMGEVRHATIGAQRHDCFPAFIDGRRVGPISAPPIFGEQTFDVYRDLAGMSDEEIAAALGEGTLV